MHADTSMRGATVTWRSLLARVAVVLIAGAGLLGLVWWIGRGG